MQPVEYNIPFGKHALVWSIQEPEEACRAAIQCMLGRRISEYASNQKYFTLEIN